MNKKVNNFKFLLITLCIIFAIVQVFLLNSMSTYGSKLNKLDEKIRDLSVTNDILSEKIASESSVLALSLKAKELGLNTNLPALTLLGPIPVAFSNLSSN